MFLILRSAEGLRRDAADLVEWDVVGEDEGFEISEGLDGAGLRLRGD